MQLVALLAVLRLYKSRNSSYGVCMISAGDIHVVNPWELCERHLIAGPMQGISKRLGILQELSFKADEEMEREIAPNGYSPNGCIGADP